MPAMTQPTVELDVRSILAEGGEPLDLILATSAKVLLGDAFDLIAPFEPTPLYAVLRLRGFRAERSSADGGATRVRFTQTGILPSTTLAEAAARGQGPLDVLNRHGMDSCCSGPKTLEFAATAHRVPLEELLGELQSAAGSTRPSAA
ncbi:MAG: DUF2249 domain-containing protein [Gemmatimonadales bacterium]